MVGQIPGLTGHLVLTPLESLHLHGSIDDHTTYSTTQWYACAGSGVEETGGGLMLANTPTHGQRDHEGYPRVRPNFFRTYNAVIDSHTYGQSVAEAEDMLLSMVDNYRSSVSLSIDGTKDDEREGTK